MFNNIMYIAFIISSLNTCYNVYSGKKKQEYLKDKLIYLFMFKYLLLMKYLI